MKKIIFIISCIGIALTYSCKDILEEDLGKYNIIIIAPTDELQTEIQTHTFLWEKNKYVTGYEFQIVSKSFNQAERIIANEDLTESTNFIEYTLSPGVYEWRVRGYNNSSETPYATHSLVIDSSLNLTNNKVINIYPSDDAYISNSSITFSWQELAAATSYEIVVRKGNSSGEDVFTQSGITGTTVTNAATMANDSYAWAVRGINDNSVTTLDFNLFVIDTVKPATPSSLLPVTNTNETDSSVTFSWTRADDNGAPISDSIFIYNDLNLTDLLKAAPASNKAYTDGTLPRDTLYWRVRSIDQAGNLGSFSQSNTIILE